MGKLRRHVDIKESPRPSLGHIYQRANPELDRAYEEEAKEERYNATLLVILIGLMVAGAAVLFALHTMGAIEIPV